MTFACLPPRTKEVPDPSGCRGAMPVAVLSTHEKGGRSRLSGTRRGNQLMNTLISASQMPINAAAEIRPAQIGSAPSTQIWLDLVPGVL